MEKDGLENSPLLVDIENEGLENSPLLDLIEKEGLENSPLLEAITKDGLLKLAVGMPPNANAFSKNMGYKKTKQEHKNNY